MRLASADGRVKDPFNGRSYGRAVKSTKTLIALLAALAVPSGASASPTAEYAPGQVIVKFRVGLDPAERTDALHDHGADLQHRLPVARTIVAAIPPNEDVQDAVGELESDPRVASAEPDAYVHAGAVPNDPLFGTQWSMRNTGQAVQGTAGAAGADIHAPEAWELSTGNPNLKIAVMDTGIEPDNLDFRYNMWLNVDELNGFAGDDDDGNGFVDDVHGFDFVAGHGDGRDADGHGTFVAGLIGAPGNNSYGIAGVAWSCQLMALKIMDGLGNGSVSNALGAIDYAVAYGARVACCAWTQTAFSQVLLDGIQEAGSTHRLLFVVPAGNEAVNIDTSPQYPASYDSPYILTVAATDASDQLAGFSNYGVANVDVAAPGVGLWSTIYTDGFLAPSGTSYAAALVTGVCGLALARFPQLGPLEVRELIVRSVDRIPALAGKVRSGGRLDAAASIEDPDIADPGRITDLAVTDSASTTATLTWTATGDDSTLGPAASYDLRHANAPITAATFAAATPVAGLPNPAAAGALEQFNVTGLLPATDYWFAIRAVDESGNAGIVSNTVHVRTLGPPQLSVTPDRLGASLVTGGTVVKTLRLRNVGLGLLDFTLPPPQFSGLTRRPPELERAEGEAPELERAAKGAGSTPGAPVTESAGGPDGFGYLWVDSDDSSGPDFRWIDLAALGLPIALTGDDSTTASIAMGIDFPFYGGRFDHVRISTNGYFSFTAGAPAYDNHAFPTTLGLANMVAPMWDDFDFGTVRHVYAAKVDDRFVISWVDATLLYGRGGPNTFQAILSPTGEIRFQYRHVGTVANEATVGIQNATRTVGLTVAHNAAYLKDSLAVRLRPVTHWLSVSPDSGRIPANDSVDVAVRFDATDLGAGSLTARLAVVTNDSTHAHVEVPVSLFVIGEPDLTVSPAAVTMDTVIVGVPATRTLTVGNRSGSWLNVRSVTTDDPSLTATPAVFSVAPHGTRDVTLRLTAPAPGALIHTVSLATNDPDSPHRQVTVSAVAVPPPVIQTSPDSIVVQMFANDSTTRSVTIRNAGGSLLRWQAHPVYAAVAPPGPDAASPAIAAPSAAAPERSGGPDAFGYRFDDSDTPGGPTFSWIDVRTSGGSLIPMSGDDANSGPFPIGFSFPFYGSNFSAFRVCTNGFLSFTSTLNTWINLPLPNAAASAPENLLAAFWDDLSFNGVPSVYYQADSARLVVQFQGVTRFREAATNSFEIVLLPDGEIVYQYLAIGTPHPDSCTIGIQNQARNDGLLVTWDSPYVHSGLAVRFRPPTNFLALTPPSGVVVPNDSTPLDVRVASFGLPPAVYRADVVIDSNDPVRPRVSVPVRVVVIGAPNLVADPDALAFGDVFTGYSSRRLIVVQNTGSAPLVVSAITPDHAGYTPDVSSLTLPPGARDTVEVVFAPSTPGNYDGTLTLTSNDPHHPQVLVALHAEALVPPAIRVAPDSFVVSLSHAGPTSTTRKLAIENTGGSDLVWSITAEAAEGVAAPSAGDDARRAASTRAAGRDPLDVEPAKDAPSLAAASIANAGGPDAFGYRWADSDQAGGSPFSWVEVSDVGARIPFSRDDQNSGPIALTFPFRFYGVAFDSVRVCSNGWLSFTSGDTAYFNTGLPNMGNRVPENLIAPYWDDIDLRQGGRVYTHGDASRFVIEWIDAPRWIDPGHVPPATYTFEAILNRDGSIDFQYLSMAGSVLNSATIGIQNATQDVGLQINLNAAYVHNGLRVHVARSLGWLSPLVAGGVTEAGETDSVAVVFDAAALADGEYRGELAIRSNDPAAPVKTVPVHLHVGGTAAAAIALDLDHRAGDPAARWIAARIAGAFDPGALDVASVRVAGIAPDPAAPAALDAQGVTVWLPRLPVLEAVAAGRAAPIEASGALRGAGRFAAEATVHDLAPAVTVAARGDGPGPMRLTWSDAPEAPDCRYDLWFTPDSGATWSPIAAGLAAHALDWSPPSEVSGGAIELVARATADGRFVGSTLAGPVGRAGAGAAMPRRAALLALGRAPARVEARLALDLPEPRIVEVNLYDVRGAKVRRLASGVFPAGRHVLAWGGTDAAGHAVGPGVYFARATAPGWSASTRIVWVR